MHAFSLYASSCIPPHTHLAAPVGLVLSSWQRAPGIDGRHYLPSLRGKVAFCNFMRLTTVKVDTLEIPLKESKVVSSGVVCKGAGRVVMAGTLGEESDTHFTVLGGKPCWP